MIKRLPRQRREFELNGIEPTAVLRREVKREFSGQAMGFPWLESLVQGALTVRGQIIQNHHDPLGLWVELIGQAFHREREIQFGVALGDLKVHSASFGLDQTEEIQCAMSGIEVVVARQPCWRRGEAFFDVRDEVAGPLIEAHDGLSWVVGLLIKVQNVFHGRYEGTILLRRDDELLVEVRFEDVFFRYDRTRSWEIDCT